MNDDIETGVTFAEAARRRGRIRKADWRNAYLRTHTLAFMVGVAAALAGTAVLFLPSLGLGKSSLAQLPGSMEFAWAAFYALGGWLVVVGILRLSPRLEAAGMWLLGSTLAVNAVTIIWARGIETFVAVSVIAGAAIGCIIRAAWIVHDYWRGK